MNETITKVFGLKGAEIQDNRIRGAAAVMGNLDRGGDVIYPGAFKSALKGFLKDGFVPVGHDWESLAVAMPVDAKESGTELVAEAEFHTTQAAQDARTVCVERLARGLSVGLSIGFGLRSDDRFWFENGAQLIKHAEDTKQDLNLFDVKAIKAHKNYCRGIMNVSDLYEFSIVSVPMNPKAQATAAKSDFEGVSLDDHSEMVLTTVREFIRRMQGLKTLRLSQGKPPLSTGRLEAVEGLKAALDELLKAQPGEPADLLQVQAEALRLDAELMTLTA